jgi:hypothetical protein
LIPLILILSLFTFIWRSSWWAVNMLL